MLAPARLALSRGTGVAHTNVACVGSPTVPIMDQALLDRQMVMIKHDLGCWNTMVIIHRNLLSTTNHGGLNLTNTLLEQLILQQSTRGMPPSHRNHQKPSVHWKETIGLLLLQPVNVGLEADLPGIWHKLADVNMKEAHAIIQEQLQLQASSLGLPAETMVTT
jgi:hypothetical protein